MTGFNLNDLSLDELKKLRKDVGTAIEQFDSRKKQEALAAVEAKAKEFGYSLADLVPTAKKPLKAAPAKYRHPENPGLTWAGRGRQPRWVTAHVDAGRPLTELLIASS